MGHPRQIKAAWYQSLTPTQRTPPSIHAPFRGALRDFSARHGGRAASVPGVTDAPAGTGEPAPAPRPGAAGGEASRQARTAASRPEAQAFSNRRSARSACIMAHTSASGESESVGNAGGSGRLTAQRTGTGISTRSTRGAGSGRAPAHPSRPTPAHSSTTTPARSRRIWSFLPQFTGECLPCCLAWVHPFRGWPFCLDGSGPGERCPRRPSGSVRRFLRVPGRLSCSLDEIPHGRLLAGYGLTEIVVARLPLHRLARLTGCPRLLPVCPPLLPVCPGGLNLEGKP